MKGYKIEHKVIDSETGIERDARKENFIIENNDNIRRAFEMLAQWHKQWLWKQIFQSDSDSNKA